MRARSSLILIAITLTAVSSQSAQAPAPGVVSAIAAGKATAAIKAESLILENRAIAAVWRLTGGSFHPGATTDKLDGKDMAAAVDAFSILLSDKRAIAASSLKIAGKPRIEDLRAEPHAPRLSDRLPGKQLVVEFSDPERALDVTWRGILRDGSHYLRQEITLKATTQDLPITEITLIDVALPDAKVIGTVQGSPVVAGGFFLGLEHPMSQSKIAEGRAHCSLPRGVPLKAGKSFTCVSVIGVTRPGQLRRDFLAYVERERAHPYRTFLHYNSWYDLGFGNKYNEAGSLDVINIYGQELVQKRGVVLSSFLFDDGWDDPHTLWGFHDGFPNGFLKLKEAAAKYGSAPGAWLSPWGGYSEAKSQRLQFGGQQGFETNQNGFALSGPVYYRRFREVCLEMIRKFGVNQFKFDGIGRATGTVPGSEFGSDFEAAIQLIHDLRAAKPDLYVNLTTGTWPSPFWLQYADSIWRGGSDHSFAGVGSDRQKWITYRDAQTYRNIVSGGPLYPINSLMLHGLIYARSAQRLNADPNNDFADEIRSYFGTGTQLQEMYVTPSLLTKENWDDLAEAARWSRANAGVLVDTHWIGGDPGKLEVYGWAAWSPARAILVLRNPSDKPATISIDIQTAFELPAGAPQTCIAHSPWQKDKGGQAIQLKAGQPHAFELKPFEVVTLEGTPR
jgi:hypothetical protein